MTSPNRPPILSAAVTVLRESGRPFMLAVLGPTATGKSALGIALAERHGGEIVSCDSTAVHAGIDIGTDKVPPESRRGVPHHLIDVVKVTESYSAADYATDAASAVRSILGRNRVPILVGGTGFYYRALTRGLFPGPGRDERLRSRLRETASKRGPHFLHRMVSRIDPPSGARIQPRDEVRLVRALEVYFSTGRTLTEHFANTSSLLGSTLVAGVVLEIPRPQIKERVMRRVDEQFRRGVVDEVRNLLTSGVPGSAQALGGLVYRQVVEHLRGVRGLEATRDLIVSENVHYARRQLIWFRKEPNLDWVRGSGESADALDAAEAAMARRLRAGLKTED